MKPLNRWLVSVVSASVLVTPARAVTKPDFNGHEAVVASLMSLLDQCASDAACLKECNDAIESMTKYEDSHPCPKAA